MNTCVERLKANNKSCIVCYHLSLMIVAYTQTPHKHVNQSGGNLLCKLLTYLD